MMKSTLFRGSIRLSVAGQANGSSNLCWDLGATGLRMTPENIDEYLAMFRNERKKCFLPSEYDWGLLLMRCKL